MPISASESTGVERQRPSAFRGALIVNADDWGRNREITDRILDCVLRGVVSSTSGMVFMADSERAAELARRSRVDVGLHLNLTTAFDAEHCPAGLLQHQRRLTQYLRLRRFSQTMYSPRLAGSFRYVVAAQIEEYRRLYGADPRRVDGHHHMHLCANILHDRLLPAGTIARRNFSFQPGDKSLLNRWYRRRIDRRLAERHQLTDFFFQLAPVEPVERLHRIFTLCRGHVLELETHPVNEDEYQVLISGNLERISGLQIASGYTVRIAGDASRSQTFEGAERIS